MKPTYQTSRPARVSESRPLGHSINKTPTIDWSFQSSSVDVRGGGASFNHPDADAFRALSDEFFGTESKQSYRLEAAAFVVLTAIAVWPIVLAAQAAFALLK
jgi:hypothetical protein